MRLALPFILIALTGCTATQDAVTATTRNTAKGVVNTVVAEKFPGVNAAPVTDCIIDNADVGELLSLSKAAVIGVTPDTYATVTDIAKRPATVSCITKNGLALLGG